MGEGDFGGEVAFADQRAATGFERFLGGGGLDVADLTDG
jgi:hypothetical protein